MFSADTAWSELRGAHFVIRFVYPDFLLNVVTWATGVFSLNKSLQFLFKRLRGLGLHKLAVFQSQDLCLP